MADPSTDTSPLPPPPQLFNLEPIDVPEPWQQELVDNFHALRALLANRSGSEVHDTLQQKASESMQSHCNLVNGLVYGILTEPSEGSTYFRNLSIVSRDGFAHAVSRLQHVVTYLRFRLVRGDVLKQLFWFLSELIKTNTSGIDQIVIFLTRQIRSGDVTPGNIKLCRNTLHLVESNMDWVMRSPVLIATIVYAFGRLILDHSRVPDLCARECDLVVRLIRDKFTECSMIGRDLVRVLQDVAKHDKFKALWHDFLQRPQQISPHFTGIEQLLRVPTPRVFLANRLTYDMEAKLLFMLEKLPSNTFFRNMTWFSQRFLATPESESLYCDLIRYICGVFHPSNALLASNILPRYVLLGAILRLIRSQVVAANAKLALFYDWLFYDPQVDSIMNIEPGVLIMARSLDRYTHLTVTFIEFLGFTADAYCPTLAPAIRRSIGLTMQDAVEKGVIPSLLPIYEHPKVDEATRKQMQVLFPSLVPAQTGSQQNAFDSDPMALDTGADIDMVEDAEFGNGIEPLALNTEATQPATVPVSLASPSPPISPVSSSLAQPPKSAFEPELPLPPPPPQLPLDPVSQMFSDELPTQTFESALVSQPEPVTTNGSSIEKPPEVMECDDSESEDLESVEMIPDIDDADTDLDSDVLPTGEQALENPSLWLFGTTLKDFTTNFRNSETEKASAAIGEIIEVFAQSEAPVKAVSNVLAYALENFEPEDIETSAELIESGDLESVEHDILHTLFAVVASYTDRAPMSRDRLLDLLIQLTTAIPDIGFRWLLYAVNDAKRPLLYRDYVGRYAKGTLQAALARDMRLLQERFNMLFYNVLPCIYKAFPAEFPGNRIIVKSVVAMIDQPQVYRLNMLMARGELRLFGDRAAPAICGTTEYDAFEQVCLWQLVAGELAGDSVAVRKIARALLLTHELDPSMNSEAANGLLSLLRSVPPTKEILAVLVQKHVQGDDAADLCGSVMTAWARSRREDLVGGIRALAGEPGISGLVAMWISRFGLRIGLCEIFEQACVIQAEPEPVPVESPPPRQKPKSPEPAPEPEPEPEPEPMEEEPEQAKPAAKAMPPKKAPAAERPLGSGAPAKRRRPMTRLQKRQAKRQRRNVITSDEDEDDEDDEDNEDNEGQLASVADGSSDDSSDDSPSDLSSLSDISDDE